MENLKTAESSFLNARIELARRGHILPQDRMAELMIHAAGPGLHQREVPVPQVLRKDKPLYAFVNHGRWMVQCECASAQVASKQDRRFFCIECLSPQVGGAWRPVIWPPDAEAIEAVLVQRADMLLQNWVRPQTLADLAADNLRHGVSA